MDVLDLFAPAVFLALSIGRLGCFSAGCCYGKPTESFLGVIFSDPECLAPTGVKIFPTQLFESVYSALIFVILNNWFNTNKLKHKIFFVGVMMYSVLRFVNEFFRGDDRGGYFLSLSVAQVIGIVLFMLNLGFIIYISYCENRNSKS